MREGGEGDLLLELAGGEMMLGDRTGGEEGEGGPPLPPGRLCCGDCDDDDDDAVISASWSRRDSFSLCFRTSTAALVASANFSTNCERGREDKAH